MFKTLDDVVNYLRGIPCIGYGGCAIAVLLAYEWNDDFNYSVWVPRMEEMVGIKLGLNRLLY